MGERERGTASNLQDTPGKGVARPNDPGNRGIIETKDLLIGAICAAGGLLCSDGKGGRRPGVKRKMARKKNDIGCNGQLKRWPDLLIEDGTEPPLSKRALLQPWGQGAEKEGQGHTK